MANVISETTIRSVVGYIRGQFDLKLLKHGPHTCNSRHEILGVVAEEYHELVEAVHAKQPSEIEKELIDVAVAAIWGICSVREGLTW